MLRTKGIKQKHTLPPSFAELVSVLNNPQGETGNILERIVPERSCCHTIS